MSDEAPEKVAATCRCYGETRVTCDRCPRFYNGLQWDPRNPWPTMIEVQSEARERGWYRDARVALCPQHTVR